MSTTICLMLKAPRAGTVKTRLAKTIGAEEACFVYRRLAEHQVAQIPETCALEIHYAPAEARDEMHAWLGAHVFIEQPGGDLGNRLRHAMAGAFARGAGGVFLIAGDCPCVTRAVILEAETLLKTHDAVIGPADDGGYYLLAMKAPQSRLLEEITWSTEVVFQETMARVAELGLHCAVLPSFPDIDDREGWEAARRKHKFFAKWPTAIRGDRRERAG